MTKFPAIITKKFRQGTENDYPCTKQMLYYFISIFGFHNSSCRKLITLSTKCGIMLDSKILRSIATTSLNSTARDTDTTGLNPAFWYTSQISHFSETSEQLETSLINFSGSGCKN